MSESNYAANVRVLMHELYCRSVKDEVRIEYGDRYGRCDLWDEETDTIYEIKSSKQDLKSGYGLNFVGRNNYLICPFELVIDAAYHLDKLGFRHVGIIGWDVADDKRMTPEITPFAYCMFDFGRHIIRESK